jgi:RNA polymerase sigma-70 factor, ECF subfamily
MQFFAFSCLLIELDVNKRPTRDVPRQGTLQKTLDAPRLPILRSRYDSLKDAGKAIRGTGHPPHCRSAVDRRTMGNDIAFPSEPLQAAIIARCQRGDRDAQRQLYESCHQKVHQLMVRMAGIDQADDLTQRVFLQVFRTIGQFAGQARLETWIYRVATNEALQHLRRSRRHSTGPLDWEPVDPAPDRKQQLEQRDLLQCSMQRLEPELRSIFLLRETEELSYREIARTLGIPEGTVGSRLNRARSDLRRHLLELGWEG